MNGEQFLLEKYKYVLEQKRSLNETTFKIVSLFQLVIAALAAGDYEVVKSAQSAVLSPATARLAIHVLYGGFLLATLACLCLLIGGIVSWVDYRSEESDIELAVHVVGRAKVRILSSLRWYETYIIVMMLVAAVGYSIALPLIARECERPVKLVVSKLPRNAEATPKI